MKRHCPSRKKGKAICPPMVAMVILWFSCSVLLQNVFAQTNTNKSSILTNQLANPAIAPIAKTMSPEGKSLLVEAINSNLVAAIIGLASALVVFYLAEKVQNKRREREEKQGYLAWLQSSLHEIEFYSDKLKALSERLNSAVEELKSRKNYCILPSFTLYPDFLERAKVELSAFQENPEVIKNVNHCLFELQHMVEKLNWVKETLQNPQDAIGLNSNIMNLAGTKSLVDSNIPVFKKAIELMEVESQRIREELAKS